MGEGESINSSHLLMCKIVIYRQSWASCSCHSAHRHGTLEKTKKKTERENQQERPNTNMRELGAGDHHWVGKDRLHTLPLKYQRDQCGAKPRGHAPSATPPPLTRLLGKGGWGPVRVPSYTGTVRWPQPSIRRELGGLRQVIRQRADTVSC